MRKLKRYFIFCLVYCTIFSMLGLGTLFSAGIARADNLCPVLNPGDMIKVKGMPAIYAVNSSNEVLYFSDGDVFKSWRENYGGYATITQECYDSLNVPRTPPAAVNYRPGAYVLKKRADSSDLFVVLPGNTLAKINEDSARQLYGQNFRAMIVGEIHFVHYVNRAADIVAPIPHPGMLIRADGVIYLVADDGELEQITEEGLTANGYLTKFIHDIPGILIASRVRKNGVINSARANLMDKAQQVGRGQGALAAGAGAGAGVGANAQAGVDAGAQVGAGANAAAGADAGAGVAPGVPAVAPDSGAEQQVVDNAGPGAGVPAAAPDVGMIPIGNAGVAGPAIDQPVSQPQIVYTLSGIMDKTIISAAQTNYLLGKFTIANTGNADLDFNRVRAYFDFDGAFDKGDLSNVFVKFITTAGAVTSYQVGNFQAGADGISDNTYSITYKVPKKTTVSVEIRGNIAATAGNVDHIFDRATTKFGFSNVVNGAVALNSNLTQGRTVEWLMPTIVLLKNALVNDKSVSVPAAANVIGDYFLYSDKAGVNLTKVKVDFVFIDGFSSADLSNVRVKLSNGLTWPLAIVNNSATVTFAQAQAITEKNAMYLQVTADIAAGASSANNITDTVKTKMTVYGTYGGAVVTNGPVDGQLITATSAASIVSSVDLAAVPTKLVLSDTTPTAAVFKLRATGMNYTVTDLIFSTPSDAVQNISVKNLSTGATVTKAVSAATNQASFSGLSIKVNAGATVELSVSEQFAALTQDTSGSNVKVAMEGFWARADGAVDTVKNSDKREGNAIYVYKAIPEFTAVPLAAADSNLRRGEISMLKFAITSKDNKPMAWRRLVFNVSGKLGGKTIGTDDGENSRAAILQTVPHWVDVNAIENIKLSYYWSFGMGSYVDIPGAVAVRNFSDHAEVTFIPKDGQAVPFPGLTYKLSGINNIQLMAGDSLLTKMEIKSNSIISTNPFAGYSFLFGTVYDPGFVDMDKNNIVSVNDLSFTYSGNAPSFVYSVGLVGENHARIGNGLSGGMNYTPTFVWSDLTDSIRVNAAVEENSTRDWHNDFMISGITTVSQTLNFAQ